MSSKIDLNKGRVRSNNVYHERRAFGWCTSCGGIPSRGITKCSQCSEDSSIRHKARREEKASLGLCLSALCNNGNDGQRYCAACRDDMNEARRIRYAKRVENKRCTKCSRRSAKNRKMCRRCLKNEVSEHIKVAKLLESLGLCKLCKGDPVPDRKHCQRCLDKARRRHYTVVT